MKKRGRPRWNIEKWRRSFDARYGEGMAARLEKRLKGLEPFAAIGGDFGLSHQRVQQITALLYPNHERQWRKRARKMERELSKDTPATRAIKYLAARGVKAELVIRRSKDRTRALRKTITVGGLTLQIRELSYVWKTGRQGKRLYYPFVAPAGEADFVLARRMDRWFVFPRWILGLAGTVHYLRDKKRPLYHNIKPRIDWWKYENATHLLRKRKRPKAA